MALQIETTEFYKLNPEAEVDDWENQTKYRLDQVPGNIVLDLYVPIDQYYRLEYVESIWTPLTMRVISSKTVKGILYWKKEVTQFIRQYVIDLKEPSKSDE